MTVPTTDNTTRHRGFGAQINEVLLRLAPSPQTPLTVRSVLDDAQRVNTAQLPEEFVSDAGQVFARSDFTGGEGLFRAHRRDAGDLDVTRFWDSRGIKVTKAQPGVPSAVTLLEATEQADSSAVKYLAYFDDALFGTIPATNQLRRIDTPTGVASGAGEDPGLAGGGTIGNLAVLGEKMYVALGSNGVHARDLSGTFTHDNDLAGTMVWAAKGRLFVSTGVSLYEIPDLTSAASNSLLKTLPTGKVWVDLIDGGEAVLAAATDGYVYAWAADGDGVLTLVGQTYFQNETPTGLGFTQGVVAVGTVQGTSTGRLWTMVYSDGQLSGSVQREWSTGAPRVFVADRESIYTSVPGPAGYTDVWRYDVVTGGMFRWWYTTIDDDPVYGMVLIGQRPFFAVSAKGTYRTHATDLVAEGWLITPLADFYTRTDKAWVEAGLDVIDVPAGAGLELFAASDATVMTDDDATGWVSLLTVGDATTVTSTTVSGLVARELALQVRLTQGTDASESPWVRSAWVRSLIAQGDVVVDLPVNVSDIVEGRFKKPVRVPGLGAEVYAALKALDKQSVLLQLRRPGETIRGQVEEIATPVPLLSVRGSSLLVSNVTVRGRRTSITPVMDIDGLWGGGPFGEFMFGGLDG